MPEIKDLLSLVREDLIREHLFYLSKDPLPYRKINYTLPGHARSTLEEADDYLAGLMGGWGYAVERERVPAQAFWKDETKVKHQQFGMPRPEDPWYTLENIYGSKKGTGKPDEAIVLIAHKDSQSWVDSPGAYDNAIGTASVLELARVLRDYRSRRTLYFIFCNEEHWPWTSVRAAQTIGGRHATVPLVINLDSPGRKRPEEEAAGILTCTTYYTSPEGKRLADFMGELNRRHALGLRHDTFRHEQPSNDDGSFIKAGIPTAVHNGPVHSYKHPHYHTEEDRPEHVDVKNAVQVARLSLAAVLHVDRDGEARV